MKASHELSGIWDGLKAIGDAMGGMFDPDKREAKSEIGKAERAARKELAKAEAAAAREALDARTAEAIRDIENGVVRVAEKSGPGFWSKANPLTWPARAGVWVVEQPVALALKPVKWTSKGLGAAFTKAPLLSSLVVAGTAAVGVGSWVANRNGKAMQAQSEAIQQMQAMQAAQMQASQPSYKNSASQAEVDARIAADREQGVAGSSKAEAVMAARQPVSAPEAATAAAL